MTKTLMSEAGLRFGSPHCKRALSSGCVDCREAAWLAHLLDVCGKRDWAVHISMGTVWCVEVIRGTIGYTSDGNDLVFALAEAMLEAEAA